MQFASLSILRGSSEKRVEAVLKLEYLGRGRKVASFAPGIGKLEV